MNESNEFGRSTEKNAAGAAITGTQDNTVNIATDNSYPSSSDTSAVANNQGKPSSNKKETKEIRGRTIICSVLFLDIVGYSKVSGYEQITLKKNFNDMLSASIGDVEQDEMIILDTGDGAALNFLTDVEAPLRIAIKIRDILIESGDQMEPPMQVRMGINLGPGHLVKDINGRTNIVGDVINVAQRVMGFAGINQILVSRSYYDSVSHLSPEHKAIFLDFGSHADKHVREHAVYAVILAVKSVDKHVVVKQEPVIKPPEVIEAPAKTKALPEAQAKTEALPEAQAKAIEVVAKPGLITRIFRSIAYFFMRLLKGTFKFIASLLKTFLRVIRIIIVITVIVVLIVLGTKYSPSSNDMEVYIGNFWQYVSTKVDKGLHSLGVNTGQNEEQAQSAAPVPDTVKSTKHSTGHGHQKGAVP